MNTTGKEGPSLSVNLISYCSVAPTCTMRSPSSTTYFAEFARVAAVVVPARRLRCGQSLPELRALQAGVPLLSTELPNGTRSQFALASFP